MVDRSATALIGARSLVGECVIPLLVQDGHDVIAFSRSPVQRKTEARVTWLQFDGHAKGNAATLKVCDWLCVAPIWVLPQYFSLLETYGARRVVALSSTSRFTKDESSDPEERGVALRLADAEVSLQEWAASRGVEWIILRPTLIYGFGRDKNIAEIARFVRRFGFFPLFGNSMGVRQPLHAQDVAAACIAALGSTDAANHAYNLSGFDSISYREMVARVFRALGRPVRLLPMPLLAFRIAVILLSRIPRYRNWSSAMAERMNRDLVFDHSEATRDLGFKPGPFALAPEDVGQHPKNPGSDRLE